MTNGQSAQLLWAVLAITLVASSLFARRMPIAKWIKLTLAWIAIFGVVYVLFLFRDEVRGVWARAKEDVAHSGVVTAGGELRIKRGEDGHFSVRGKVNGRDVDFMIDTGATVTTLSADTAKAAGVEPSGGFPVLVETANGTVEAQRARIKKLEVGSIVQKDAPAHIGDNLGDNNLLGMSFLSTLSEWRVEGNTLVLAP